VEFFDPFQGTVIRVHRSGSSLVRAAAGGPWWAGPIGQWAVW
jgi:hypothetical protein